MEQILERRVDWRARDVAGETAVASQGMPALAWLVVGPLATVTLIVFVWRQTRRRGQVQVVASETDPWFRQLFDEAPVGMTLATADEYRFVRVNPAFCRMLGYSQQELVGHMRDEFAAPNSIGMRWPSKAAQAR